MFPGGAKGAIALTFDNLGETADISIGKLPAGTRLDNHPTASRVVPLLIDILDDLKCTFFIEGASARHYSATVQALLDAGHEVAFHAMRHELWVKLTPEEEAANLAEGMATYKALGHTPKGFRPPGGALIESSLQALADAGYDYVSPVGRMAKRDAASGTASIPFSWKAVDAYWFEADMAPVRTHKGDGAEVQPPSAWASSIDTECETAIQNETAACLIFHLYLLDPETEGGAERLQVLRETVAKLMARSDLYVAPAAEIATHLP